MARKTKFACRMNICVAEWTALSYDRMAEVSGMDVAEIARLALIAFANAQGYRAPQMPIANGQHHPASAGQ
jgi:hypothetical protein